MRGFNSSQANTAGRFEFSSNDDFSLVRHMLKTNQELMYGHHVSKAKKLIYSQSLLLA